MIEGPKNYVLQSNEIVELNITPFIQLRNNTYITILNPVKRTSKGAIEYETFQQVKLNWGDEEIRTSIDYKDPFPLYPGEVAKSEVTSFLMVNSNEQVKLQAIRSFKDNIKGKDRKPGDIWMVRGPMNLIPRVEFIVLETIKATIIANNSAIRLRALRDTTDKYGKERKADEEWLIREVS